MDAVRQANERLRELQYEPEDARVEPNGSPSRLRLSGRLLHETTAEADEMLALLAMLPPKVDLLAYRVLLGDRERLTEIESDLWRDAELARALPKQPLRKWVPLVYVECGRISEDGRGWRAELVGFAPPTTVGTYCPDCAAREFGDD